MALTHQPDRLLSRFFEGEGEVVLEVKTHVFRTGVTQDTAAATSPGTVVEGKNSFVRNMVPALQEGLQLKCRVVRLQGHRG